MEKADMRKQSPEQQAVIRKIIIRMKQQNYQINEIAESVGCSECYVSHLWGKYNKARGKAAKERVINEDRRGRVKGENRTLTMVQEKKIQKIIINKYPDQLQFDFALWTRDAVRLLIKKEFDIQMPIRTVGEYLMRWGWTPQKPVKYSYERNSQDVKEWLENEYPSIKKHAKRVKGEIYWGDETSISTSDIRGRGYAPKGKTPVVKRTGKREHISMVSAITNQGKVFWKIFETSITALLFFEFVKRLVKRSKRKIFLIVDNLRIHRSIILQNYLAENKDKIEIFYLPAYSPDLNPNEHLNADVKNGVGTRAPKKTKGELRAAAEAHLKMLSKTPCRIIKYFDDPKINYAA
jgi:transposase